MPPVLDRMQETLFFGRNTFTEILFLFMMFCIYPIVAEHFEMFFGDVYNQFLDEVQSRDGFSNRFVVLVSGVMKGYIFAVIIINTGCGNNRSAEVSADVFNGDIRSAETWLCTNIKTIGVFRIHLRIMVANRKRLIREMTQIKNRFARWFAIYFPEYTDVFGDYEAQSSMLLLKKACTPEAIVELGAEKINQIWRDAKLRAVGMKRATTLCETAKRSIGLKKGSSAARYEMKLLLEDYEYKKAQLDAVMEEIEKLCRKIPESEQMLAIKGIGVITVAGFLAEVGDVRRFESPRQIQKLAGLSLRENSSGKHKGQTTISKRGRSKLRAVLFNAAIPLIAKNPEFRSLHEYYTTRTNNPLKKKQSVIAISCKLIRVFYAILANGVTYDAQKMLSDIHRQPQTA